MYNTYTLDLLKYMYILIGIRIHYRQLEQVLTCMFNLAMEYTAAVIFNKWDTVQPVNKLDITRQVCLTSRDINLKLFFLLNFKIKQGISIDFHI